MDENILRFLSKHFLTTPYPEGNKQYPPGTGREQLNAYEAQARPDFYGRGRLWDQLMQAQTAQPQRQLLAPEMFEPVPGQR